MMPKLCPNYNIIYTQNFQIGQNCSKPATDKNALLLLHLLESIFLVFKNPMIKLPAI